MPKKFAKRVEDFVCDHCGLKIIGTGYTDHCPDCLWSKHVDVNPGDRWADCGGLMEPVGVEKKSDNWRIFYRCQKCRYHHVNRAAPNDNIDKIIALSKKPISLRNF